MYTIMSVIV